MKIPMVQAVGPSLPGIRQTISHTSSSDHLQGSNTDPLLVLSRAAEECKNEARGASVLPPKAAGAKEAFRQKS